MREGRVVMVQNIEQVVGRKAVLRQDVGSQTTELRGSLDCLI